MLLRLCLFKIRAIKLTINCRGGITATKYIQNFMEYSSLKVNWLSKRHYWDRKYGSSRNRSINEHIFCIFQILEKIWEYNGTVHQLFVYSEKACDSVRKEVLYTILNESVIPMKLVMLIKMCLNKIYSEVHIGKNLSDAFPIQNGLK